MNNAAKYILAVLIVIALAEAAPKAINTILILILAGVFLKRAGAFTGLFKMIGSLGKS